MGCVRSNFAFGVPLLDSPFREGSKQFRRAIIAYAAPGKSPAAFDRRCIPAAGVARRPNIPDIFAPRDLSAGRLAGLSATRDFYHGLLAGQRGLMGAGSAHIPIGSYLSGPLGLWYIALLKCPLGKEDSHA